jgi:starch-binding outer membrane protein, SusD/RagB family
MISKSKYKVNRKMERQSSFNGRPCIVCKLFLLSLTLFLSSSCEDFLNPEQDLVVNTDKLYSDWHEYRAAELGLYALQQRLVEQLIVLGELRGDLLTTTQNSSPALIEVSEFNISRDNPYASPYDFYRLIAATNSLIRQLKLNHPKVLDPQAEVTNYDRLYGEALCMRAWAYFTAVRIYGKIPYVYESLTSVEEISEYVTSGSVISEFDVIYGSDGSVVDTVRNDTVSLNRKFLDLGAVIDTFTHQLENNVKVVGVNHSIINGDITWEATIWTTNAMACLLGEMYLYDQNYVKALEHFNKIMFSTSNRFLLGTKFRNANWRNIFQDIDIDEHIFTIWFNRSFQQTNRLQQFFSPFSKNHFVMKPSKVAVEKWETIWAGLVLDRPTHTVINRGNPGDFHRGHRVSYIYFDGNNIMSNAELRNVLEEKSQLNFFKADQIMSGYDVAVQKYSIGKADLDHDANISIYRAADIHLYVAEIYARLNVAGASNLYRGQFILNNGAYKNPVDTRQLGVRGRVGFGGGFDGVDVGVTWFYKHNPYTNAIDSIINLTGKDFERRILLADAVMDERARELAFEGKRFYDLARFAKRRNDPAYLADRVAAKFAEPKKSQIRQHLMNEENWYINYFD